MRKAGLVLAALGVVALAAAPGRSATSGWSLTGGYSDIQQPVEQQSRDPDPATWVTNPTGCPWDADDVVIQGGAGTVSGTVGVGNCAVADGYWHKHVYAAVDAAKDGLTVTLTNSNGESWDVPMTAPAHWQLCIKDPTGLGHLPEWYPVIPDSNGGRGIQTTYTLAIMPTSRTVRSVNAGLWVYGTYTPYPTPC